MKRRHSKPLSGKEPSNMHTLTLKSMAALVAYCQQPPQAGAGKSSDRMDDSFFGTPNLAAACQLAVSGWKEGAEKVARALAARKVAAGAKTATRRSVTRYDVSGDDCDVARYCSGDPENMTENRRVTAKGKTVRRVNVALNFSSDVSGQTIMDYAVAVCAAVQRIEAGGNRVELWVKKQIAATNAGPVALAMEIRVKEAGSRMHPAALAFACGHPSFYRRLLFAVVERFPNHAITKISAGGYGFTKADTTTGYLTTGTRWQHDHDVKTAIAELENAK
jgi:hypothetical protein